MPGPAGTRSETAEKAFLPVFFYSLATDAVDLPTSQTGREFARLHECVCACVCIGACVHECRSVCLSVCRGESEREH